MQLMDDVIDIRKWDEIKIYTSDGQKVQVVDDGKELIFRTDAELDIREM